MDRESEIDRERALGREQKEISSQRQRWFFSCPSFSTIFSTKQLSFSFSSPVPSPSAAPHPREHAGADRHAHGSEVSASTGKK